MRLRDVMVNRRLVLSLTVLLVGVVCLDRTARASVELDFSRFTSNSPTDVAQYLRVSVSDIDNGAPGGRVRFDVSWSENTPLPELVGASIKKVWIMDGMLDGGAVNIIDTDSGVDFEASRNKPNFPSANSLNFSPTFTYESTTEGANSHAVQPGESVGFEFTLKSDFVFQDVVDAINNFDGSGNTIDPNKQVIRVALHVGTLDDISGSAAASDKFLSGDDGIIPEPASGLIWLTFAGLGMIASCRPKR